MKAGRRDVVCRINVSFLYPSGDEPAMRSLSLVLAVCVLTFGGHQWLSGTKDAVPGSEPTSGAGAISNDDPACQAGCSIGSHPINPLAREEYRGLLDELADGTMEEKTAALDALLFHGARTRELIADDGFGSLDSGQAELLRRELLRTHARVWLRVVDELGITRVRVDGARFPLGIKEHVHPTETNDLPPPEISGTVHRTGLHHLWTRI